VATPLQPDLHPPPPWQRRLMWLVLALAALVGLGMCSQARRPPPRLLLTGPGHAEDYAREVDLRLDQARHRVWALLYLVRRDQNDGPVSRLMDALAAAAKRGVEVRVCLDQGLKYQSSEPDPKNDEAVAWLRARGVDVRVDEMNRTSHSKLLVIDQRWVVMGSHNWTWSALSRNREASLLCDDSALAAEIEREVFALIPGWSGRPPPRERASEPAPKPAVEAVPVDR